jgi:hypothetical protein
MAPKAPTLPTAEEIGSLVPIGRIAKETPYSADFLRQLARSGKIRAFKLNRDWLTTPAAIRDYLKSQTKRHEKALSLLQSAERAFLALTLLLIVFSAAPSARAEALQNPPLQSGATASRFDLFLANLAQAYDQTQSDVFNLPADISANFQFTKNAVLPPLDYTASLLADSFRLGQTQLDVVSAQLATNIEEAKTTTMSALAYLAKPFLVDVPDYALVHKPHHANLPILARGPENTETAVSETHSTSPMVLGEQSSTPNQSVTPATPNSVPTKGGVGRESAVPSPSGSVLGISTDLTPQITTLVQQLFAQYAAQWNGFTGPNGMVQNDNNKTTAVVGGAPIISYVPASSNGNFTGGTLAGFTDLSSGNLTTQTATIQGLTVSGSASIAGSASVAGNFTAATSTLSSLTVSGQATFSANLGIGTANPSAPFFVAGNSGPAVTGTASGVSTGDSEIAIRGSYAYSARSSDTSLLITDISNPAHPVLVSTYTLGNDACAADVKVVGQYAYLMSVCSSSIATFDIADAKHPVLMSRGATLNFPVGFDVQGKFAYTARDPLTVTDISNPTSQINVTQTTVTNLIGAGKQMGNLSVSGRYMYLTMLPSATPNFYIIDLGSSTTPSVKSSLTINDSLNDSGGSTIGGGPIVRGRYVYLIGLHGLYIVDVSDATTPVLAGSISISATTGGLQVQGRYAYIAQSNGVAVYDVSNVASPAFLGLLTSTPTGNIGVSGRYAFTSQGEVLDLGGAYAQALVAGGISADTLNVRDTARFQNNVDIFGGVNVGSPGLYSSGPIGISAQGTGSNILSVTAQAAPKSISFDGIAINNNATSATASLTKTGINVSSTGTWNGASAINIGLYISSVTGGTKNYDAIFNGGGNVGIGSTSPTALLTINGTTTSPSAVLLNVASSSYVSLFNVQSNGNVGIGTTTPTLGPLVMGSGAFVTAGGTWTNASDRNLKENFATLSPASILEKIDQLPITEWDYKTEGPSVNHIGPVAQDFWEAFHLGNSQTSISTIDPAGVALLGIQALDQKITALQGSLTANATTTNGTTLSVTSPSNFSGDSVGEAEIIQGGLSVRVTFSQPYAYQPIITITSEDQVVPAFITAKDASGFTIQTPAAVASTTIFDWHSFASPAAQLTVSGMTQPIPLILPAAPSAQPPTPPLTDNSTSASDPGNDASSTPPTMTPQSPSPDPSGSSTPPSETSSPTSTPPESLVPTP